MEEHSGSIIGGIFRHVRKIAKSNC